MFWFPVLGRYLKPGASSMSVIEIGYPSGFSADRSSINPHPLLKRVEEGDKKVILYLDEVIYIKEMLKEQMLQTNR